jgi:hypothetical protein
MPSIERLTDLTIMREITEFREKSNAEMALISAWQGYESDASMGMKKADKAQF